MKLTDALRGEHGAFYALFNEIDTLAAIAGSHTQVQSASAVLNALVKSHAAIEDGLLFTALEPHLGKTGPLGVMRAEHEEIERALVKIEDASTLEEAAELVPPALAVARSHFQKEERVLFQMAERLLDEETLTRLGRSWADARGVSL
ncbi:MAG: hemerythrin domain-containing protein [Rhodospirillales bacterium]|nr:hemerythrin domain-containing protein [Rhodospirillales bacterium]